MIKDEIVKGAHNASHRSLYHALGLTAEELDRPLIGVVITQSAPSCLRPGQQKHTVSVFLKPL